MTTILVFIDSAVTDRQALIDKLPEGAAWHLLNGDEDGIAQMARIASDYDDLAAIHVIAHGSPGTLHLGNSILNHESLSAFADGLRQLGASLVETGDVLVYGCNVAYGEDGRAFIDALGQAIGAEVAGSIDPTGSTISGGNWTLEQATGPVEATALAWPDYAGILAANTAPTFSGTLGGTVSFTENGSPVLMDGNVQVFDAQLAALNGGQGNYDGAWLYLSAYGGAAGGTTTHDRYAGANIVPGQNFGNVIVSGTTVGNYSWGDGILTILFNANATQSLVNQTLQSISYVNTNEAPAGSTTVYWTFFDGNTGSQGTGGELSGGGNVVVNITAVNDAPTATNQTVAIDEDGTRTFAVSDFGFSDVDGNTLSSVRITSLESAGALKLDGVDVTLNQDISASDINSGLLTYTPGLNQNGAGYASFGFKVSDGTALSSSAYSMTIDVTAVNDAPTFSGTLGGTVSYTENGAPVVLDSDVQLCHAGAGEPGAAVADLRQQQRFGG